MKFVSTRGKTAPTEIRKALEQGLAPDGGLFIPEFFPTFTAADFKGATALAEVATWRLAPFFDADPALGARLPDICRKTFHFSIPLRPTPRAQRYVLELFHGPTCAFKDVGARFLAECMRDAGPSTVMVATSGDTGGAVAAAFYQKSNIDVVILYPRGMISKRQEAQLCGWGQNIRAIAVEGTFDDCQRLVKETLLKSAGLRPYLSANSINLGRILPQMVYYAHAALIWPGLSFVIPSGNLGNALACIWAKKIGLPIGDITLAFNANRAVPDYLDQGTYVPAPTVATLANAMDVGNPSNLERLRQLYPGVDELRGVVRAGTVTDDEIREAIRTSEKQWGQALCPHSAVAAVVADRNLRGDTAIVATAHPAKFESIVEPLIGHAVEVPPCLKQLLNQPLQNTVIRADLAELESALQRRNP